MPKRKLTDAQIIAGIREATSAWNAPQDTDYYAEKFHVSFSAIYAALRRLEADGRIASHQRPRSGISARTWTVMEETP